MAYSINKTDGSLLVSLVDSGIDKTATDLVLIGKNVTSYGEYINENFIKLLENFASTSQPNNPIAGQIWFDIGENRLKVYDGSTFRIGSGPIVQGTSPLNPIQGDFWIDNLEGQLYFYTGVQRYPASKIYKDSQGKSGFTVETVADTSGNRKTVVVLWCADKILGIFSKHPEFTLGSQVGDYTGLIKPGFNQGLVDGFKFNSRSTSSDTLLGPSGVLLTYDDFMLKNTANTIFNTLTIQNATPLVLGVNQQTEFNVSNANFQILSNRSGQDFKITTLYGSTEYDAITVKSATNRIGIFNTSPQATLDVGGDIIVAGNLTVNGTTTSISTVNLEIEDKLIDLGKVVTPTDITADGGGIRLLGTTNHTILWSNTNDSWDLSEHLNIAFTKEYRINNQKIIDRTSLGSSVAASSLTSVGTLTSLATSNGSLGISLSGNTISTTGSIANVDLLLNTKGTGNINAGLSRIVNLADPFDSSDAATAYYVDSRTGSDWITVSDDYDALVQDRLSIDTTSGSITISLPPNPSSYQFIKFIDSAGKFDTDPLKIVRYRYPLPGTYGGTPAVAGTYTAPILSAAATVQNVSAAIPITATVRKYTAELENLDTTVGFTPGNKIFAGDDTGQLFDGSGQFFCRVVSIDSVSKITYEVVGETATLLAPVTGTVTNVTITGIPTTTTSALGAGAEVEVTVTGSPVLYSELNTTITVVAQGYNYQTGDTITVDGEYLGGISGANDLTFSIQLDNIFGLDSDYTVDEQDAAFGLIYLGSSAGWKYLEQPVFPPALILDITGNVVSTNTGLVVLDTSLPTATFAGTITGATFGLHTGPVTGNVTGNVSSIGDNSFATATISGGNGSNSSLKFVGYNQRGGPGYHGFLEVTNTFGAAANPNKYFRLTSAGALEIRNSGDSSTIMSLTDAGLLTASGGFQGNVSNSALTLTGSNTLNLTTLNNSITMSSGAGGILIKAYDNTQTLDHYAIQVTPATSSTTRTKTLLFGDVSVENTSSSNVKGSSFKLPTYNAAGIIARGALSFLNYGELIYNSTTYKVQAYVKDGVSPGVDGWIDLH